MQTRVDTFQVQVLPSVQLAKRCDFARQRATGNNQQWLTP
jgi:hypothetical protein